MKAEFKVLECPYPRDNQLNAFGDYTSLKVLIERHGKIRMAETWYLDRADSNYNTRRYLNDRETVECLKSVFFSLSKVVA